VLDILCADELQALDVCRALADAGVAVVALKTYIAHH